MNAPKTVSDLERYLHDATEPALQDTLWYAQMKEGINELIQHDFDGLLQLLYRADVSESKLRDMLAAFPAADASGIIANLLLERQLQKIKSREENKPKEDDAIPDEERW